MGFGDIPIRQNGIDQIIEASWFNTIRTKLLEAFGSGAYILVQSVQAKNDGEIITVDATAFKPFIPLVGIGALVTLNSLPFTNVHGFGGGKEIVLMGTDDSLPVKIPSNDIDEGIMFNGESVTLKKWNTVTIMYYDTEKRFIELSRNF